ncbi:DNA-3-methyladenine glycosylase [Desertivirga arenae]|uniref:DNA-3-methyladenine glycosylase n=1 Tax=Desertivirga arenae TaxID=2810309 RepID=UPI001A978C08|nr:DNA-3-methyladenine glycosylase [Pedobacter sp. SYSU D00823]
MKIASEFYQRENVVLIASELLGKVLCTDINGQLTAGIIVETEAYKGPEDLGSHAYNDRRTPRNEIMYAKGGVAYMYICYGIHNMLNIVTGAENSSHAVLIRALEPVEGIEIMRDRRQIVNDDRKLCKGPGALAKAMGLTKSHNGISLQGGQLWLEDKGRSYKAEEIIAAPRIGLNIAEPYRSIPWRFYIRGSSFISRG